MTEQQIEALAGMIADKVADKIARAANKRYVSRKEFAKATGLGVRTVDRMITQGRLEHSKQGRRVLIPVNEMSRLGNNQAAQKDFTPDMRSLNDTEKSP
ncbi:MAG: helix-turn-helix domain-containing protein [Pirellulales bacterium]